MQKLILALCVAGLVACIGGHVHAGSEANPFSSYLKKIEFLEKRLKRTEDENQRKDLQARIDDIKDEMAADLEKRKAPFVKRIESHTRHLETAQSDSKRKSLQNRIDELQRKVNVLDAFARGLGRYDVHEEEILEEKEKERVEVDEKRNK